MANLVDKIPVVVDGESAYDFRLKINQAITGVNNAFESINREYNTVVEASAQYEQLQADVNRAQDEVETYVETVAKPEIHKYFEDFIENGVEDLSTVQLRRNAPVADSTGYLPDFWYKIERGSSPLVLYAKLISPSAIISDMKLTKNSDWNVSNNSWTIRGSAKYNKNIAPTTIDKIGVKFMLEDGCRIISKGYAVSGIQPEYDEYSKTIYWNCGRISSWSELELELERAGGDLTAIDVNVSDGVLTQRFNINITLSAK